MNPINTVKHLMASEAGRRQPISFFARILAWQLWRRILRRPMEFQTVTGTRLRLLPKASDSLSGFWYHQLPDFEELTFALHLIRNGDTFVDIGANQGGWTLLAAGRGARVISFEPIPETLGRLQMNVQLNQRAIPSQVRIHDCALGEVAGEATFTRTLDAGNRRIKADESSVPSTVVKISTADQMLAGERARILKIDVEGGELQVLLGARQILASPSLEAIIMETFRPQNFRNHALIESEKILGRHGFVPCAYDPWKRSLTRLMAPGDGGQNTIYIRDMEAVSRALVAAAPVRAFGRLV